MNDDILKKEAELYELFEEIEKEYHKTIMFIGYAINVYTLLFLLVGICALFN